MSPDLSPLRGHRILDFSRHAPGPFATLVAALLGADVLKVELPEGGDPLRAMDRAAFERLNAGKRSITLDLKSPEGTGVARRLAKTADVLVEGFRPGAMERLGLDYESLRRDAPALVYVSISGYGQSGPYRERAGHDVNYMAASGALYGARAPLPLLAADFAAGGLFAVTGILAALLARRSSGVGAYLDLSMHHGLLSLLPLAGGPAGERLSGRYPNYTLYRTKDGGFLSVGALELPFWRAFCETIGRPDLASRIDDPEARSEAARVVETRELDAWEEAFSGVDACVEPVRSPEAARRHAQARHRDAGDFGPTLPFGPGTRPLAPAPDLGQHTDEVLLELGYTREELSELRQKRVC